MGKKNSKFKSTSLPKWLYYFLEERRKDKDLRSIAQSIEDVMKEGGYDIKEIKADGMGAVARGKSKMAVGTDMEILKGEVKPRKAGRPQVNRELGYQLIKAKPSYSTSYICRVLKCSTKTVRRLRQELVDKGDLESIEATEEMDKLDLEFDDECKRAVGISFAAWLKTKTQSHRYIFNFCQKTWINIWGRPSLIIVRNRDEPLGDQICMKFLDAFGEDIKRIRRRKKLIRYIFRFLGRQDLCDRYLTMTRARDPEPIREIPELTLLDFPRMIDEALTYVLDHYGTQYYLALRFKLVSQMRTGDFHDERELFGLTCGDANGSWIMMADPTKSGPKSRGRGTNNGR